MTLASISCILTSYPPRSSPSDHEYASEQCHHHRQRSRTCHDLVSSAKRRTNFIPSAPVLLTFVSQAPVKFSRVNRLLQTCECSCHLEIRFLFTKCPSAHRSLFVSLESEEVFIQILCHLRNRRTAYFFADSPKQVPKSEPFSSIPVVQSLDQVARLFAFRSEQSHHMCCRQSLYWHSQAISVPTKLYCEVIE